MHNKYLKLFNKINKNPFKYNCFILGLIFNNGVSCTAESNIVN